MLTGTSPIVLCTEDCQRCCSFVCLFVACSFFAIEFFIEDGHKDDVFVWIPQSTAVATLAQLLRQRPLADVLQLAWRNEIGILELLDALAPFLLQCKTAVAECYALLIELCLALFSSWI